MLIVSSDKCWLRTRISYYDDYTKPKSHLLANTFMFKRKGECTFRAWGWKGKAHGIFPGFTVIVQMLIFPIYYSSDEKAIYATVSSRRTGTQPLVDLLMLARWKCMNDQFQISPAASPKIWHHTVWRTWLSIAYSDERWFYYQFSLIHTFLFRKVGRMYFLNLGVKGLGTSNMTGV